VMQDHLATRRTVNLTGFDADNPLVPCRYRVKDLGLHRARLPRDRPLRVLILHIM